MTYDDFVSAIVTILNVADAPGIAAFDGVIARCIAYAELRMQRDFDFLATSAVDLNNMTIGGSRLVPIASGFIVLEGVNLIIPAGYKPYQNDDGRIGERIPLQRATRQFLDLIWPSDRIVQSPNPAGGNYYALFSMHQDAGATAPAQGSADQLIALPSSIIIAPTPDNEYVVEQTGTKRTTPLSSTNTSTFISIYMEDIFLAAALKWGFAYQRDFGSVSNDPQAAQSWENEYRILARNLDIETLRQKSLIGGYSSLPERQTPIPQAPVQQQVATGG